MNDIAIHDRFFKSTLGVPERLEAVLRAFLPSALANRLEPQSLRPLPTESLGEDLSPSFMDLAFSARLKDSGTFRIHLVMEHKSAPDPRIHYQLVHYLTGLWIRQIRDGQEPLPVLPVLFYHGKAPWALPKKLSEDLRPPDVLAPSSPDFSLFVIDVARIEDREIRDRLEDLSTILALLTLKHVFDGMDRCFRIALKEVRQRKASYDILRPILSYLASYHDITRQEDMKRILVPILREEGMPANVIDLMFEEALQKGIELGTRQGIELGTRQEKDRIARTLLGKGRLSPEEVAQIVGLDPVRVHELAKNTQNPS